MAVRPFETEFDTAFTNCGASLDASARARDRGRGARAQAPRPFRGRVRRPSPNPGVCSTREGFTVKSIMLVPRPTQLETFGRSFFKHP